MDGIGDTSTLADPMVVPRLVERHQEQKRRTAAAAAAAAAGKTKK